MAKPRYRRRKGERPAEITAAAMDVFSEKGYSAARVDDVARRAGVSKGLMYLYFKTKEDLFKSVIRSVVVPRVAALSEIVDRNEGSVEEFIRGPFLDFARALPGSPARIIVRLMVAEGYKHPDLTAYYWENVVNVGMSAITRLIGRGVKNGEFRPSALDAFPQLLISPVLFALLWTIVFNEQQNLDTDAFLESHIDIILDHLLIGPDSGAIT